MNRDSSLRGHIRSYTRLLFFTKPCSAYDMRSFIHKVETMKKIWDLKSLPLKILFNIYILFAIQIRTYVYIQ